MGSANIGSRGASWTKELGVLVTNCPALGADASKLIQLYWDINSMDQLPSRLKITYSVFLSQSLEKSENTVIPR